MSTLFDTRRYLTNFDSTRTANIITDVLVVGSGVAGIRAALEAARYGNVILLTKGDFEQSCTAHAQGGIAAALASDDSIERHYEDTMTVGCGLNRPEAVRLLVTDGPARIEELIGWGMELDRTDGRLDLAREGGHSACRIVHARGDQTGAALVATLKRRLLGVEAVRVYDHCFLIDLLTHEGACVGAVTYHAKYGHQLIWASQTVLASGGCGRVWRETTNPPVATGDGMAAAFRAGATLADMEMMQFHPTTLYVAGAGRALISEAVRGEGAHLVDRTGRRFMFDHHADGELAPRDVVSRAIHRHLVETRANCVYLDVRHIAGFRERFPGITRQCADVQIDVTRDLIPVRPTAHYMIGGVEAALNTATSVPGLWCCGEASCSGVHGANRLASNSLLEGLIFGRIAGENAGREATGREAAERSRPAAERNRTSSPIRRLASNNRASTRTELDLQDIHNSLRSLMWRNVGIERSGERLTETREILEFWGHYTLDKTFDEPLGWEIQNKLTIARLIALSALERKDSIGVHYRSDGVADGRGTDDGAARYHVQAQRAEGGTKLAHS